MLIWEKFSSFLCSSAITVVWNDPSTHTKQQKKRKKKGGDDPTGVCVLASLLTADGLCSIAFCHARWPSLFSPKPRAQTCSSVRSKRLQCICLRFYFLSDGLSRASQRHDKTSPWKIGPLYQQVHLLLQIIWQVHYLSCIAFAVQAHLMPEDAEVRRGAYTCMRILTERRGKK